jgi:nucleoside-diphosphate-sugar epimerase
LIFKIDSKLKISENISVKRVVMASTSGVVGCRKPVLPIISKVNELVWGNSAPETPNDDSPYCTEIVSRWPYYLSKIKAEQQTLVCMRLL